MAGSVVLVLGVESGLQLPQVMQEVVLFVSVQVADHVPKLRTRGFVRIEKVQEHLCVVRWASGLPPKKWTPGLCRQLGDEVGVVLPFVLRRSDVPDRRVPSLPVVEDVDPLGN